jgi:hypothetical protein
MYLSNEDVIVRQYAFEEQYRYDAQRLVSQGYRVVHIFVPPTRGSGRRLHLQGPRDNCVVTYQKLH